ncbi:hypothetical protein ACHAQI_008007 [Fusarium lateritium]
MSDYPYPTAHSSPTDQDEEVIFLFARPCARPCDSERDDSMKGAQFMSQRLETPELPELPDTPDTTSYLDLTASSPPRSTTPELAFACGDDFNDAPNDEKNPSLDQSHEDLDLHSDTSVSSDIFDRPCVRAASQTDGESLIDILNELDENAAAQEEALQALIPAVQTDAASNKAPRNVLAPWEKHIIIRALSILARMRPKEIATLMNLNIKDVHYALAAPSQPGYGNGGWPTAMTHHIT